MLVRGVDRFGHFELESRPQAEFDDSALPVHQRLFDQRIRILMRPLKH